MGNILNCNKFYMINHIFVAQAGPDKLRDFMFSQQISEIATTYVNSSYLNKYYTNRENKERPEGFSLS